MHESVGPERSQCVRQGEGGEALAEKATGGSLQAVIEGAEDASPSLFARVVVPKARLYKVDLLDLSLEGARCDDWLTLGYH